jgi:hypothetical protein
MIICVMEYRVRWDVCANKYICDCQSSKTYQYLELFKVFFYNLTKVTYQIVEKGSKRCNRVNNNKNTVFIIRYFYIYYSP